MANDIKDFKSEETKLCSEKLDDIMIAECYIDEEEGAIPPHIYPLSFKLLQKEQQKDKTFLEALKKSETKYDIKIFQLADKSRSLICQEVHVKFLKAIQFKLKNIGFTRRAYYMKA
eukprot:10886127-Ditylum_brightwellii.AAC.1